MCVQWYYRCYKCDWLWKGEEVTLCHKAPACPYWKNKVHPRRDQDYGGANHATRMVDSKPLPWDPNTLVDVNECEDKEDDEGEPSMSTLRSKAKQPKNKGKK